MNESLTRTWVEDGGVVKGGDGVLGHCSGFSSSLRYLACMKSESRNGSSAVEMSIPDWVSTSWFPKGEGMG